MPATPYKRDRRMKTRLDAQSDSDRANLRQKALQMAEQGLNRRGGPVDQGSPASQKAAADRLRNERAVELAKMESAKQQEKRAPQSDQRSSFGALQLHRNTTGNARSGGLFRRIAAKGGEYHKYNDGRRVFVRKPESGGTGNHPGTVQADRTTENVNRPVERAHKPSSGTYDRMARDLAKIRATQNRPNARRKLFRRAG